MNKGVLASLGGAIFCLLAGQPVGFVFCLILAWVARSGSDAINAATTQEQNNNALIFWSVAVLVVAFFMVAFGAGAQLLDPNATFVTDDALLRALLED
jgi:hypothetical protein